jgi:hypothetical protein
MQHLQVRHMYHMMRRAGSASQVIIRMLPN